MKWATTGLCDFCDGWYHENCSGLPEVIISQLSQAKYLLFRCSLCLDNKKNEETTRKVIKDTIQKILPSTMKTVLEGYVESGLMK